MATAPPVDPDLDLKQLYLLGSLAGLAPPTDKVLPFYCAGLSCTYLATSMAYRYSVHGIRQSLRVTLFGSKVNQILTAQADRCKSAEPSIPSLCRQNQPTPPVPPRPSRIPSSIRFPSRSGFHVSIRLNCTYFSPQHPVHGEVESRMSTASEWSPLCLSQSWPTI